MTTVDMAKNVTGILDTAGIAYTISDGQFWINPNGNTMNIDQSLTLRVYGGGMTLRIHKHDSLKNLSYTIDLLIREPKHWMFN